MSTQTADTGAGGGRYSQRPASARATFLSDTWVIARRGLLHMRRQPEALSDATIQPVMFVLLFAFVFGGAISVPGGGSYKEFLMGGIFAQTIVFGCFGVALALSNDRNNGAIDRFHSLPIPRSSVLAGHAVANLIRAFLPIAFMTVTGFVVGWRIHSGILDVLGAYGLMLVFSFAMIWVGVLLGSLVATPEGVQGVAFVVIFPVTFIASTFVPTSTLPGVLKTVAEWNPTSSLANALRHLFENPGGALPADGAWPLQHPVAYTLLWAVGIVVICAPLAVMQYQRSIKS
jgi:ABC-2 type transport system permease protein